MTGGDDYELLIGVPPAAAHAFESDAASVGVDVSVIGETGSESDPVIFLDDKGAPLRLEAESFQHFR